MKTLNKTIVSGGILIAFFLAFWACTPVIENSLTSKVIRKPFKALHVPSKSFAIRADRDTVVRTESGTRITFPANTLADASGKPVSGEVNVEYTEYQNATDILLSGIRMTFDSCGTQYGFESAGMFSINATDENGDAVFVQKGRAVNVQMASFREGDDFTFYYLDTVSGKWEGLGTAAPAGNTARKEQLDSLDSMISNIEEQKENTFKPKKYQPGDKIINLDIDYSKVPELKPFHALIWRYAGAGGSDDPAGNTWIYTEKWQSVGLTASNSEKGKYLLSLVRSGKSFNTVIEPVLQGKDMGMAQREFDNQMAAYDKIMTIYKNEMLRAQREAKLVRSFGISQFGIYNWDKFYKDENSVNVMADFTFDKSIPGAEKATVYLVIESRNAVIPYYNGKGESFSFIPSENNKLVAVMPDESIAVAGAEAFIAAGREAGRGPSRKVVFKLRVTDKKMASNQDVTAFLSSI